MINGSESSRRGRVSQQIHDEIEIAAYSRGLVGYADHVVMRQAESVGARWILVARPPQIGQKDLVRFVGLENARLRVASKRVANLARMAHLELGEDAASCVRLHRLIASADVVYSRFLDSASDLLVPLRGRHRPAAVVCASGSDITTIRHRPPAYVRAVRAIGERADTVLCGSRFLQERFAELVPGRSTILHHFGIPVPNHPAERPQRDEVRLVCVSRLVPVKGIDLAITSFAEAFKGMERVKLRIIGDGPLRADLSRLATSLGVGAQVSFSGRIPPTEVYAELADADVFVQHNVRAVNGAEEGLGATLLQAAACALPVVATRSGGAPETMVDGQTGHLVEPGDTRAMATALRHLVENPSERSAKGRAGFDFVRRVHNAETQDARLGELLRAAASR